MYKFENWTWCRCWLPLLGAIAGDRGGCTRWRIGRGAVAGCHCWDGGGGGCTRWRIGRGGVAGCH